MPKFEPVPDSFYAEGKLSSLSEETEEAEEQSGREAAEILKKRIAEVEALKKRDKYNKPSEKSQKE